MFAYEIIIYYKKWILLFHLLLFNRRYMYLKSIKKLNIKSL